MDPRDDEPQTDAHLRAALRHAPDHDAAPPATLSQAILAAARAAVPAPPAPSPWGRRLWRAVGRPGAPWGAALASLAVVGITVGLWHGQELPTAVSPAPAPSPVPAQPAAESQTPPAPAAPEVDTGAITASKGTASKGTESRAADARPKAAPPAASRERALADAATTSRVAAPEAAAPPAPPPPAPEAPAATAPAPAVAAMSDAPLAAAPTPGTGPTAAAKRAAHAAPSASTGDRAEMQRPLASAGATAFSPPDGLLGRLARPAEGAVLTWQPQAGAPRTPVDGAAQAWLQRLREVAVGRWQPSRGPVRDAVVRTLRFQDGDILLVEVQVLGSSVRWHDLTTGQAWLAALPADVLDALRRP